jgi:WS/DGAT/MGAT family acyltransferase
VAGLPDGRWALVWRVHHSIADGIGAVTVLGHGFDTAPDGGPTLADVVLGRGEPARAEQGERAAGDTSDDQHHPPGAGLAHVIGAARSTAPHLPGALAALVPHAPSELTGPVGDGRVWVSVEVPLAQVKAVRRTFGVTVNDVVLACVTGGFRDLLRHRGAPVRGRVVRNLVPVSLRPHGDAGAGNQVSALLGHLPVGIDDPVDRLRAVASGVDHGQQAREPALAALLLGIVDHVVPAAVQDVAIATAGRTLPAWFFDTLTTNVPGPQFPVHVCRRRVRAMFPIIPVAGHTCITTGIFSYDGMLDVGVSGDADRAADVGVLARGIRRAADELAACAG